MKVLITGGAGFIGSHLADELLRSGYEVRVLDNLSPQVHGAEQARPGYLAADAELLVGDLRSPDLLRRALDGVDAVCHLASAVGVGQSMYQIEGYVSANELATAALLQCLVERPVRRLLVASSMSIYGEGLYRDAAGRPVEAAERSAAQLRDGEWELRGADGGPLEPAPTPESKRPNLASVYALNKYAQERMCLIVGRAYDVPTTALRFFNVYGTRQALSNPYTGVLAIFASRLLNDRPPLIFEDGGQRRDFVHVRDVARACRLALEAPAAADRVYNVGSGRSYSVRQIAEALARTMGKAIEPEVTSRYRVGDIRHCFADMALARQELGFEPRIGFDEGLAELVDWLSEQIAVDRVDQATDELARRGLVA